MIGLSASTYDIDGAIVLNDVDLSSTIETGSRRIAKYKTLDSGVTIVDNGFVSSDASYALRIKNPERSVVDTIRHLISTYSAIIVTSLRGAWRAVISQYSYAAGELTFTIELIEEA